MLLINFDSLLIDVVVVAVEMDLWLLAEEEVDDDNLIGNFGLLIGLLLGLGDLPSTTAIEPELLKDNDDSCWLDDDDNSKLLLLIKFVYCVVIVAVVSPVVVVVDVVVASAVVSAVVVVTAAVVVVVVAGAVVDVVVVVDWFISSCLSDKISSTDFFLEENKNKNKITNVR